MAMIFIIGNQIIECALCEHSIVMNQIVGVLFGLTDYAYWLYVTDLGVDRDYLHQGIGKELMETAHSLAGGKKDVAVYLVANENAISFYEKLGMRKADDVMEYNHIEWTEFTVK